MEVVGTDLSSSFAIHIVSSKAEFAFSISFALISTQRTRHHTITIYLC
jgi:hypothetical protein